MFRRHDFIIEEAVMIIGSALPALAGSQQLCLDGVAVVTESIR